MTPATRPWLRWGVAIVVWLAVWQAGAMLIGHEVLLVSPVRVLLRLGELAPTGAFWASVGYSLARIAAGFVLAVALGFGLALLASLNPWLAALIEVPVRVIRSVPVVSVIILILIWANAAWLSATVSCLMVLPIVYANAAEALATRDGALDELARVFEWSRARRWWARRWARTSTRVRRSVSTRSAGFRRVCWRTRRCSCCRCPAGASRRWYGTCWRPWPASA